MTGSLTALIRGKGLLGNTIKTMAISVGILLVNVLTGVITARLLGPEGRGLQMAMILWPQFLAFSTTLGLHAALLYHVKKTPEDEDQLYYSSLFMTIGTGLAAMLIGLLLIPLRMGGQFPPAVVTTGQLLMVIVPFMHLFFIHNARYRAREEFARFNRMRYLIPLITLGLLILLAAARQLTPYSAAAAYLLPYAPVALWALYKGLGTYRLKLRNIRDASRRMFRYGLGSYGVDLLGNLILYIDQIILVGILAPQALGLYVVAVSLSRMVNVFSASIIMVLFPQASGLEAREAAILSLRVYKLSTFIALAVSAVVIAVSPLLIRVLYGTDFLAAIPVFRYLLLEVVIGGAALVLGQAFMAAGKPWIVSLSQGIGLALIVPLLYGLVPLYGIEGAGLALLLAALVRLVYMLIFFEYQFRLGISALWLTKADVRWLIHTWQNRKSRKEGEATL